MFEDRCWRTGVGGQEKFRTGFRYKADAGLRDRREMGGKKKEGERKKLKGKGWIQGGEGSEKKKTDGSNL